MLFLAECLQVFDEVGTLSDCLSRDNYIQCTVNSRDVDPDPYSPICRSKIRTLKYVYGIRTFHYINPDSALVDIGSKGNSLKNEGKKTSFLIIDRNPPSKFFKAKIPIKIV